MVNNNNVIITNPCISICKTDPLSGFCYGCGRSNEDKNTWKDPETSDIWKQNNIQTLRERLTGWQLDAFDKSYKNKTETGLSLLMQKIKDSKK